MSLLYVRSSLCPQRGRGKTDWLCVGGRVYLRRIQRFYILGGCGGGSGEGKESAHAGVEAV